MKNFEVEGSKGKASFVYDDDGKLVDIELISRTSTNPFFKDYDELDAEKETSNEC